MNSRPDSPLARAVAARAQGRHRLRAITMAAGTGGVALTGVVIAMLPAATHKSTAGSASSSSQGSSSAGTGNSASSSSSNSGSLGPAAAPSATPGGAQSTSGGS